MYNPFSRTSPSEVSEPPPRPKVEIPPPKKTNDHREAIAYLKQRALVVHPEIAKSIRKSIAVLESAS